MSLEETKKLLKEHQIVPNKRLGQNFMVDPSLYPKLSRYAKLEVNDTVLDAGAGLGFLARFLAAKCKGVVAVEKDAKVALVLREQVKGFSNVAVAEGNVLNVKLPFFNKAVSLPPYYLSSDLVLWLLDRKLDCAILVVQKDFASRLVAQVGTDDYGWLAVVASQAVQVELLDDVASWAFFPQPEVDSTVVKLKPWAISPFVPKNEALFRRLVKWLFTQRNKKLENAAVPFIRSELKVDKAKAAKIAGTLPLRGERVRALGPESFGVVADALSS